MSKLIDMLFGLIAYFCVATVITLGLIVAYWWRTDRLTNDKIFRVMAVLQDVDLQKMATVEKKSPDEVPPAEPSVNEVMHNQQLMDRNFEVKQLALERGKQEYNARWQLLVDKTDRYDQVARSWQARLKQEQELTTQQNLATVVNQLQQLAPEKAKEQLMLFIEEDKMDDAILLMSKMSEGNLKKILKTLETEKELAKFHEMHVRIMQRGAENKDLEKTLGQLDALDGKNNTTTGTTTPPDTATPSTTPPAETAPATTPPNTNASAAKP
jgi:hypothetical protein